VDTYAGLRERIVRKGHRDERVKQASVPCADIYQLCVSQMLNLSDNILRSLPDELSCLRNLKELDLSNNVLPGPPVSVLSKMMALSSINLSDQSGWTEDENDRFKVSSSLLPIFNPGLLMLDLRQRGYVPSIRESRLKPWDGLSLFHLGRALADLAGRKPVPTLLF
jgi:hypothetical protein